MEKLLIPRIEAAELLSVSVDTLDRLTANGYIKRVCIGSRAYYASDAMSDFVKRLTSCGRVSTWEVPKC